MTGLHHNKTARITGKFIGINMNYITDTIIYYNWVNSKTKILVKQRFYWPPVNIHLKSKSMHQTIN